MTSSLNIRLLFLIAPAMLLAACAETKSTDGCRLEPGFKVAWFDKATLDDIMDDDGFDRIRFYGVRQRADDNEGTVMAIAVDQTGRELDDQSGTVYRMSQGLDESNVRMERLDPATACRNLFHIVYSGKAGCITELDKEHLDRLFQNDAEVMKVVALETTNGLTMNFIPAKWENDRYVDQPEAIASGTPCPTNCGSYENYVCLR